MKENGGTKDITKFPLYPYLLQGQQVMPSCKPISVGRPGDKSYRTPSPHPTATVFNEIEVINPCPAETRIYAPFANSVDPDQLASEEAN